MVQPELDSDTLLTLNRQVIVARTVSGTAHDVNNALQIIGGSADILAQNPDAPGAAQRAAARIRAQTDRAAESLRMLMELARASETVESRLTLGSVVTQALALRAHPIRRSNVTVHFDPAQ